MASKILFLVKGNQYLHEIRLGGFVTSEAEIIWDERKDGPIPVVSDYEVVSREGKNLTEDPVKVQAKQDRIKAEDDKKKEIQDAEDRKKSLIEKLKNETATQKEKDELLLKLMED